MKILIGNIFDSKCKTLVNTVNCVGVMGKGIAKEFKERYPQMFKEYQILCKNGKIKPGQPYYFHDLTGTSVINFPTKDHWRSPSKFSYIIDGLNWFRNSYKDLGITSVAFPPLGCGNGGVNWEDVGPYMYKMLNNLPIEIEIYAPYGTSAEKISIQYLEEHIKDADEMIYGSKNIPFNNKWLLILEVVRQVNDQKYALHVGRVIFQKICYILTRSGIETGFTFTKASYGPFSKEVKESISALSNANLIVEMQKNGQKMVETHVTSDFIFHPEMFSSDEIQILDKTVDLFCRIKNTEQAEMMATVIYSYDDLLKHMHQVSEEDILQYVLDWKSHWINSKEEIKDTIRNLLILGWIKPELSFEIDEFE